jgi:hypothetical protein
MSYAYKDPPSIRTVALAVGIREISDIVDASAFDTSSQDRSPHLGEIVVWQNTTGVLTFDGRNDSTRRRHGGPRTRMYREALK